MKATVTKRFEGAQEGGMKNVGEIINIADESRLKELEAAGVVKRGEHAKADDDQDTDQDRAATAQRQAPNRQNERQMTTASYPTATQRENPKAASGSKSRLLSGKPKAKR